MIFYIFGYAIIKIAFDEKIKLEFLQSNILKYTLNYEFAIFNVFYQNILYPNNFGGWSSCWVVQWIEFTVTVVISWCLWNAEIILGDNVVCKSECEHDEGIQSAVFISLRCILIKPESF